MIGWLMGPIGRWAAMLAALLAWTTFNRVDAARKARAECNQTHLEARIEAQQKRAEEADRIAEAARARADATEAEMAELERTKDALLHDLADEAQCALSDDFRDRLRALGGDSGQP
jgi:hypothetical protein